MEENQRMVKLFKDLFNGDPWLDSSIIGILSGVSAQRAARKPENATNSIWEIANHVADWREVVLARIHGAPANTPEHNYFLPVEDESAEAWQETLRKLQLTQDAWLGFLETVSPEKLSETYLDSDYTVYDLVFGIMQHDAYHLGQMALVAKYDL
jgi:uncharacterized damage-inducible protein DinB